MCVRVLVLEGKGGCVQLQLCVYIYACRNKTKGAGGERNYRKETSSVTGVDKRHWSLVQPFTVVEFVWFV